MSEKEPLNAVAVVLGIGAIAGVGYLIYQNYGKDRKIETVNPTQTIAPKTSDQEKSNTEINNESTLPQKIDQNTGTVGPVVQGASKDQAPKETPPPYTETPKKPEKDMEQLFEHKNREVSESGINSGVKVDRRHRKKKGINQN
jgi:hypothetical protein